jgi:hypothetical protein
VSPGKCLSTLARKPLSGDQVINPLLESNIQYRKMRIPVARQWGY